MQAYLLFRLYGPMAAWGDTAVGEFRPTQAHPSRTAVLGLLAAALGIRRDQEERLLALDRATRVAVRLDLPGELLRDYHTTQVPPAGKNKRYYTRADELRADKLHTILSQRDYQADCGASIALQQQQYDGEQLAQWQQALRHPVLPLYLGRKACPPALPLEPEIINAAHLKDAFDRYPDCHCRLLALTQHEVPIDNNLHYFWEGDDAGLTPKLIAPRRDRLLSRKRWQFDSRNEYRAAYPRATDKES